MNLQPVFQVSEFVETVNQHLRLLGEVVIEGEISRIDIKNGRLIFATIKDEQSAVDVFGLTHIIRNVQQLEAGMKVHVYGTAGLYKGSGRFRVQAAQIVPHGEGSLQIAFEKLKQRLELEGLFDESHRRVLPDWPVQIGLITAAESSAYFDLEKVLTNRMSGLVIRHLPVNVQGREAVPTIQKALTYVNKHARDFDVVIVARGGGSLEDLQAFNSEEVTRAVFGCKVPVVTAVGHEDDTTLVDFVADMRAATPSNAAELVVKDKYVVKEQAETKVLAMRAVLKSQVKMMSQRNDQLLKVMWRQIQDHVRRVNEVVEKVVRMRKLLIERIGAEAARADELVIIVEKALGNEVVLKKQRVDSLDRLIRSYEIGKTLQRGFSITRSQDGSVVQSADDLSRGDVLETTLAEGQLLSTLDSIKD